MEQETRLQQQSGSVKKGAEMASVLITESLEDLDLKPGDTVQLISKAIHVLTVK